MALSSNPVKNKIGAGIGAWPEHPEILTFYRDGLLPSYGVWSQGYEGVDTLWGGEGNEQEEVVPLHWEAMFRLILRK